MDDLVNIVILGRILGIDYGTKRTGLAVTDSMQLIANGLTTVPTKDLIPFLIDYCKKEAVASIVVGLPKKLNNEIADVEQHIKGFIRNLQKQLPGMEISRYDERFTSKMAFQTMIDGGLKKKNRQNKELLDQVSAAIILQSYLENRK